MGVLAPPDGRPEVPSSAPGSHNSWDGLVVFCSSNSWDDVKLATRHMAEQFTAHAPVLYVDPPASHLTRFNKPAVADSLSRPRLRLAAPGIARYTPLVAPKPMNPAMVGLTSWMVRRQLRAVVRRLGGRVDAVVSTWLFVDAYGVCGEKRRLYWWQDDPMGAAALWNRSADRLARGEERLARSSDLVVTVSDEAAQRFEARGVPATFLPNGCDPESFAHVDEADDPADVDLPHPIAGFVGHINGRTDLALLEAVADAGVSLLLVGPKAPSFEPERFSRLADRQNVAYIGTRSFEELPSYLKAMDVGLVPYADTAFNRGSFPMKTLEYLTAGRPCVATPLPALRWLNTDLVGLAESPEAFAASVLHHAALAGDSGLVARRREFASGHTWANRAEELATLLELPGRDR
jgi:teichuronic acid biosynthesis glycosyltransferase TuaH